MKENKKIVENIIFKVTKVKVNRDNTRFTCKHRQLAMYLLKYYFGYSHKQIGAIYKKTPETVGFGIEQIQNTLDTKDKLFYKPFNEIICLVKSL